MTVAGVQIKFYLDRRQLATVRGGFAVVVATELIHEVYDNILQEFDPFRMFGPVLIEILGIR